MGFFEDGYLEAVVRRAGSDRQQNYFNCKTIEILSSTPQSFLQAQSSTSSLIGMSHDASPVLVEGSPQMSNNAALTKSVKVEKVSDLPDILDSGSHHSSPAFVLESAPDSPASIYSSSARGVKREAAVEVDREVVLCGVEVGRNHSLSSCSLSSELKSSALTPQRQIPAEVIPTPISVVAHLVSSSEIISATTLTKWPSPENQTDVLAKHSQPSPPPNELSSHSLESESHSSKQQGSKRRKGQQKRVVCVPIAGTGRSSAEVLPSDMWAWRKYGQKPIKGSPYPRGYYRCSSSKGCSARKQVERSRNDPTMLMITYTSEHNHARPAHRNSLAGTTRAKSLDKLRSIDMHQEAADTAALFSGELDCNLAAASMSSNMSSWSEKELKQESPSPSPLDEYNITSDEGVKLVDEPHMRLDNPSVITITSSSQDQQLFQDLEALHELSSTIIDENLFYYRADDEIGIYNMDQSDPFELFCWSSSSTTSFLGNEIVG